MFGFESDSNVQTLDIGFVMVRLVVIVATVEAKSPASSQPVG
jgi:hypothetical protein